MTFYSIKYISYTLKMKYQRIVTVFTVKMTIILFKTFMGQESVFVPVCSACLFIRSLLYERFSSIAMS